MQEAIPNRSPARLPDWIATELRAEIIAHHQPGSRLPTVLQLARRFDVSSHTVTKALEVLACEGLIKKWPGSGTYVADRPAHPAPRVGIMSELDLLQPLSSAYFTQLVLAAREQLEAEDLRVEVYLGRSLPWERREAPTCDRFVADLRAGKLAGVLVANAPQTEPWDQLWKSATVPVVNSHLSPPGRGVDSDYAALIRAGLEQLAAQGCRRVALLGWGSSAPTETFLAAAAELGLAAEPALIRYDLHPAQPGSGWEEFREIWTASAAKPDGLLITDDGLLEEVAATIGELGIRVPDQLRVASLSHGAPGRVPPFPMTLLEVDTAAAARIHVETLLHQMGRRDTGPATRQVPFVVNQFPPAGQPLPASSRERQASGVPAPQPTGT